MNIYEKMQAIMDAVQYLAKDGNVEFGKTRYKAMTEEKVTATLRAQMVKQKLLVYPIEQSWNRQGQITHVDVKYRIVNVEAPDEYIEVVSCGDGADTQDKGSGKAMTYAFKYMWLRTFAIPTGEDPDKISSEELDDIAAKKLAEAVDKDLIPDGKGMTPERITRLQKEIGRTGVDLQNILDYYKIENIRELNETQYCALMNKLLKKESV